MYEPAFPAAYRYHTTCFRTAHLINVALRKHFNSGFTQNLEVVSDGEQGYYITVDCPDRDTAEHFEGFCAGYNLALREEAARELGVL